MGMGQPVSYRQKQTLYTPAERARRDATVWTLVQGILAPLQFLAFAISLCLVINFLLNGVGFTAATVSVVIKTSLLTPSWSPGRSGRKSSLAAICSHRHFSGKTS